MRGTADGGQPDRAPSGCIRRWRGHGVASQQGRIESVQRLAQAGKKPRVIAAKHIAQQNARRHRSLGSKVGQVGGDEFPGHVRHVLRGQPVHAFDHHVMRQHQGFAAELEHGGVVDQPARRGIVRHRAQRGNEAAFVEREGGSHPFPLGREGLRVKACVLLADREPCGVGA